MFLEKKYHRQSTLLLLLNKQKYCTIKELSIGLGVCSKTTVLELENLQSELERYKGSIYTKRKRNMIKLVRHSSFNLSKVTSRLKRETLYFKMVNFYLMEKNEKFNHFLNKEFHSYSYGYKYRNHLKEVLNQYNLVINSKNKGMINGNEWQIRLFMLDFYNDMYLGEHPFFEDSDEVKRYLKDIEKIQNKTFTYQDDYLFRQIIYIIQQRQKLNHVLDISYEWQVILRETEKYQCLYTRSKEFLQSVFNSSNEFEILFMLTVIYSFHPAIKFQNRKKLICKSEYIQTSILFFESFQQEFSFEDIICDEFIYQFSELLLKHKQLFWNNLISEKNKVSLPEVFEKKIYKFFFRFMEKQGYSIEEIKELYPDFIYLCGNQFACRGYSKKIEVCIVVKMKQEKEAIISQLNNLDLNLVFVEKITAKTELVLSNGILINHKNIYYYSAPLSEQEYGEVKEYLNKLVST